MSFDRKIKIAPSIPVGRFPPIFGREIQAIEAPRLPIGCILM